MMGIFEHGGHVLTSAGCRVIAVLVLLLGFWPRPLLNLVDKGSVEVHRLVDKPSPTQVAAMPVTTTKVAASLAAESGA